MARVVIRPPHSANCGADARRDIHLVRRKVVQRLEQQAEGLLAQRRLALRLGARKAVGLQHRHGAAGHDHRAFDGLDGRRQELVHESQGVEDVAHHRREQARAHQAEEFVVVFPHACRLLKNAH
jgi:hypothetical protein